jgi:hypothetical protein
MLKIHWKTLLHDATISGVILLGGIATFAAEIPGTASAQVRPLSNSEPVYQRNGFKASPLKGDFFNQF